MIEKFVVIKQFEFYIPNVDQNVRAEIKEMVEPEMEFRFFWTIDHRWKAADAHDFYYPSRTSGQTFEECEIL